MGKMEQMLKSEITRLSGLPERSPRPHNRKP
jgi:hypothetical protein